MRSQRNAVRVWGLSVLAAVIVFLLQACDSGGTVAPSDASLIQLFSAHRNEFGIWAQALVQHGQDCWIELDGNGIDYDAAKCKVADPAGLAKFMSKAGITFIDARKRWTSPPDEIRTVEFGVFRSGLLDHYQIKSIDYIPNYKVPESSSLDSFDAVPIQSSRELLKGVWYRRIEPDWYLRLNSG